MRHLTRLLSVLLWVAAMPMAMVSCGPDEMRQDDPAIRLEFSVDTLSFDTVFATVGTANLRLTVYNRASEGIELSSVTLGKGRASRFRLNVDGDTSLVARRIEIEAGDSIFIFVTANIDPNDQTIPYLVEDAILFSNGQRLPLTAWGRNAIYHVPPADTGVVYIGSETWTDSLPHIIVRTLCVKAGHTLTITDGAEVYFADTTSWLVVDSAARLVVQGTAERPVLFSSVRHDGWYSYLPGQWFALFFNSYSTGNVINHAVMEKGTYGVYAYPESQLSLSNVVFRNMSQGAIIGKNARITGRNLLAYDCLFGLYAIMGGSYEFDRCTFANYWNYSSRKTPTLYLSNYILLDEHGAKDCGDMQRADFNDCIIWGNKYGGEWDSSFTDGYSRNYRFNHSVLRGGEWDEDPLFADPDNDDYSLREGSPATGIGYPF